LPKVSRCLGHRRHRVPLGEANTAGGSPGQGIGDKRQRENDHERALLITSTLGTSNDHRSHEKA
jgi:hypothetical protein